MEKLLGMMEDEAPYSADEAVDFDEHLDDMEADECVQKINNWERFRSFWLDYYAKKIEEVNEKCDRNIAWNKRKLRVFFSSVPHRATKTMEAYDLPHGRLSVGFSKQKFVPDKKAILARFEADGREDYIKLKKELDWDGYKSQLFISDSGDVLDKETGEIVSDVSVEMSEPELSVAFKNKKGAEDYDE